MNSNQPRFASHGSDGVFLETWEGMDLYYYDYENDTLAIGNPIIRVGDEPQDYRSGSIFRGELYDCDTDCLARVGYIRAQARALALAQRRGLIRVPLWGGIPEFRAEFIRHGGVVSQSSLERQK